MRVRRHTVAAGLVIAGSALAMGLTASPLQAFGGSETSNTSAPAGGAALTNTDQLPGTATQGSLGVTPLSGDDLASFNAMIAAVVDTFPNTQQLSKKGQATLGCVLVSYLNIATQPDEHHVFTVTDLNLQAAMLDTCLQLARSLPGKTRRQAVVASATCGRVDAAVTVRVTHSRSGYQVTTVGPSGGALRPAMNVSCRHNGTGLVLGIKPRKRGQTLRQAGASELGIAYSNPSTKTLGIRTTFKAR